MSIALQEQKPLEVVNDIGEFIEETTLTSEQKELNEKKIREEGIKMNQLSQYLDYEKDPSLEYLSVNYLMNPFNYIKIYAIGRVTSGLINLYLVYSRRVDALARSAFIRSESIRLRRVIQRMRVDPVPMIEMVLSAHVQTFRRETRRITNDIVNYEEQYSTFKTMTASWLLGTALLMSLEEVYISIQSNYGLFYFINVVISNIVVMPTSIISQLMTEGFNLFEYLKYLLRFVDFLDGELDTIKEILRLTPIVGRFLDPKAPSIDIRALGEIHLKTISSSFNPIAKGKANSGSFSYCGPGTMLHLRDIPNTKDQFGLPISRPFSQPINELDLACKYHDYSYVSDGQGGFTEDSQIKGDIALIRACDRIMLDDDISFLQKLDAKLVRQIFEYKLEFIHGVRFDDLVKQKEYKILIEQQEMQYKAGLKMAMSRGTKTEIIKLDKAQFEKKTKNVDFANYTQYNEFLDEIQKSINQFNKDLAMGSIQPVSNRTFETNIVRPTPTPRPSKSNIVRPTLPPLVPPLRQTLLPPPVIPPVPPPTLPPSFPPAIRSKDFKNEFVDFEPDKEFFDEFFTPEFFPKKNIPLKKPKTWPNKKQFETFKRKLFFLPTDDDKKKKREFNKLLKLIKQTKNKMLKLSTFVPVFL